MTATVIEMPTLSYTRTVDRALVHRDSLGEVFLTDLQPVGDSSYAAGAQLPRSHAYYGDHLLRPSTYDPVLLLEACRQSALAGAHAFYAVPEDHKFILTHLRIHLTRPERIVVGTAPCALSLHVTVTGHRRRDGRTTGLDYDMDLGVKGTSIGRASIGLRFKSPANYLELRLNNRDGKPLPTSATYPQGPPGTPVEPYLVGRANADNVVLTDATSHGSTATATLRIPGSHPSMFDHPQDHLPGMVIAEAARQLALFGALDVHGMSPSRTFPTDLSVTFSRFGELEHTTHLTAEVGEQRSTDPDATGAYYTQGGMVELGDPDQTGIDQVPVRVEATQNGASLCVFSLSFSRIGAQG
ncbi:ScbA/BarX family gamma-butyrolactone biosynthesis protein [Streptomyces sp. NPDC059009]|uniref:ScbA/BarX family gamma-butyrolactone biosynthesis protein n=1 Tax=Streptomyces sp. NPDC059009 TaxID=3346694 RepID=UPI003675B72A